MAKNQDVERKPHLSRNEPLLHVTGFDRASHIQPVLLIHPSQCTHLLTSWTATCTRTEMEAVIWCILFTLCEPNFLQTLCSRRPFSSQTILGGEKLQQFSARSTFARNISTLWCNTAANTGFCVRRSEFRNLQHPTIVFRVFPALWGDKCPLCL